MMFPKKIAKQQNKLYHKRMMRKTMAIMNKKLKNKPLSQ